MRVGIDFDNTICCYDSLFHCLAAERGLVDECVPVAKAQVRDHLHRCGKGKDWTELQGIGYGVRLGEAAPFPGVREFLLECRARNVECFIISHKTRKPIAGPEADLHEAAWRWLEKEGFLDEARSSLSRGRVYLEPTKQAKLARVDALQCDYFIDDLPELLTESAFPVGPQRILFDPWNALGDDPRYRRIYSWREIADVILHG